MTRIESILKYSYIVEQIFTGYMNLLQSKFDDITINIQAENGEISEDDYENKIEEALRQIGVNPEN